MKFLDSNGVRKIKEYVDNKFVTADAYSVIEGVERDTYTKQEIDTMLADIDSDTDLTNYYTKTESDNKYATTAQIPTRTSQLTNNSGFITSESDPVFSASAAAGITSSDITNWNSKTSNTGTVTQVKIGSTAYNPSSGVVSLPAYPTTLPASDVSSWAKASSKPTYTAAEVGALPSTTTIPAAPGTLITNATTAQTASSGEAMSGNITLHKVAKTGTYSDLIGKPTIPAAQVQSDWNATSGMGVILNKPTIPSAVTESTVSGWGFTKNAGTITGITMNGSSKGTSGVVNLGTVLTAHQDISGKQDVISDLSTIRSNASAGAAKVSANNSTITIQKGGTTVDSFTTNANSAKTINIPNELPSFTSSDNGKILMVVNGTLAWVSPTVIYSGSAAPSNSTGNNGDVYLQS